MRSCVSIFWIIRLDARRPDNPVAHILSFLHGWVCDYDAASFRLQHWGSAARSRSSSESGQKMRSWQRHVWEDQTGLVWCHFCQNPGDFYSSLPDIYKPTHSWLYWSTYSRWFVFGCLVLGPVSLPGFRIPQGCSTCQRWWWWWFFFFPHRSCWCSLSSQKCGVCALAVTVLDQCCRSVITPGFCPKIRQYATSNQSKKVL